MDSHAKRELDVFSLFAACSPLRVSMGSIQKRTPPEPDIVCELEGGGGIAFELVELADSIMVKTSADTATHRQCFNDAIAALGRDAGPEFRERYGTGFFHFSFREGSSLRTRKKGITEAVKRLARMSRTVSGDVPLPKEGLPGIEAIMVGLCGVRGPMFDDTKAVNFRDPSKDNIVGKLRRCYQSQLPVELLAYYDLHPVLPESHWLPRLAADLKQELPPSQFRRVWVFDKNSRRILLVWPDLRSETG